MARLRLATTEPPKTTTDGEFWITSYRLGNGGGAVFIERIGIALDAPFFIAIL